MFTTISIPSARRQVAIAPQLNRDALPPGLIFCAVPVGNCFVDLVTGLRSSQADASNHTAELFMQNATYSGTAFGTARPGEQAICTASNGASTSGHSFPAQMTRLDMLTAAGTLLCLGGCSGAAGNTHVMFGSLNSSDWSHGYVLGIDDFSFDNYGEVIACNDGASGSWTHHSTVDSLSHDPKDTLHFFGSGWDDTNQYFYVKGARQTVALTRQPTLQATRITYILRSAKTTQQSAYTSAVALAMAWDRALTAQEYNQLWQNPWVGIR